MKKLIVLIAVIILVTLSCKESPSSKSDSSAESTDHKTETGKENLIITHKKWVLNEGLINIESVVYDSITDTYYATCGLNYQPGFDGFITSISGNGKLLNLKWIDSLSRPTGMAIYKRKLYVADIDHLLVIEIDKGVVTEKYPEPLKNSGLNDVAISNEGDVFVTASAKSAVYRLAVEELQPWVSDQEQLKWANGIEVSGDQVIVGGESLSSVDINTGKISSVQHPPALKDIEGIALDGNGGYYLTTVENSALWHLDQEGEASVLFQEGDYLGDLDVLLPDKLIIPRGNNETGEYYLSLLELEVVDSQK